MELELIKSKASNEMLVQFDQFEQQALEWKERADQIIVTSADQIILMEEAKTARLALRNIRINVDKKHKELKEDALKTGQFLDQIKRKLTGLIEPIEKHLEAQEKFIQIQEEEAKSKLKKERSDLLRPYLGDQVDLLQLAEMDQIMFDTLLSGQKLAKQQREEQELKAIEDKKAAAEKEAIEHEELKAKNAELQKQKEAADAKAKKEREARLKLEQEAKEKAEIEAKELKDKQAADRKLKRAPDKVKLAKLSGDISAIALPDVKDDEAKDIVNNVRILLAKVTKFITDKSESL